MFRRTIQRRAGHPPAIAWRHNRSTPYVPSPLLYGDKLYLFAGNNGILSCFDAKSGRAILEPQRISGLQDIYASPVGGGGRVYLVGRNGATVVINHSATLEVLATNRLDERFDSSPAYCWQRTVLAWPPVFVLHRRRLAKCSKGDLFRGILSTQPSPV